MEDLDAFLENYEPEYEFPWKLTPMKHQRPMADWHMSHNCSFDQSSVGVGKTAPMVVVLQEMLNRGQITKILIVASTSILDNWGKEISKGSSMSFVVLRGTKQKRLDLLRSAANCYIINYEGLRVIIDDLLRVGFDAIVADEAHHIKTPPRSSQQTKCALMLAKQAHVRKAMSGTLITNNLMDIWSISQFVNPNIFKTNEWGFRAQYLYDANAGAPWKKYPDWRSRPGAAEEIKQKLSNHAIGYNKRDVLKFLPPVTTERRSVELTGNQRQAYRELRRQFILELDSGEVVLAPQILPRIAKLLEITSGFVYTDSGAHRLEQNAKLDELLDVIEQIGDDRAIIWTSFTEDAQLVRDSIKRAPVGIIDGSVKQADRQPLVDAFNDNQIRYLVCNAACAGEGLTILAPYSIYYSRNWKLGERIQSLGRFDRPGAERFEKLTVIDIVAEGTVDAHVLAALDSKEDLLKSISPKMAKDIL